MYIYMCLYTVPISIYLYSMQMEKMKKDALRKVKPLAWLRTCKNQSTSATVWI